MINSIQADSEPNATGTTPSVQDEIGYRYIFAPTITEPEIVEQYRKQASEYDEKMRLWGYRAPKDSAQILAQFLTSDSSILDAGCGTGLVGEELRKLGFNYIYGLDLSQAMLQLAAQKEIYKGCIRGDLTQELPYETNSFDAAICTGVLTHIPDSLTAIKELLKVVKQGGLVLIAQRMDLFESRGMSAELEELSREKIARVIFQSDWHPYVTNHADYQKCGIRVGYFLLKREN